MKENPQMIDAKLYHKIEKVMPIICVDAILVKKEDGVKYYGLVKREDNHGNEVWCHVGGRAFKGISLEESMEIHMKRDVGINSIKPIKVQKPIAIIQYFPYDNDITPHDDRKQAVALLYKTKVNEEPIPGKDTLGFAWFTKEEFPEANEFGFGHGREIRKALGLKD